MEFIGEHFVDDVKAKNELIQRLVNDCLQSAMNEPTPRTLKLAFRSLLNSFQPFWFLEKKSFFP